MNKVYGVELSPYVRKVLFALESKDQAYELELTLPFKIADSYFSKHPLGKVPCFEDEYVTLPDSSIICDYLDQKYPNSTLNIVCDSLGITIQICFGMNLKMLHSPMHRARHYHRYSTRSHDSINYHNNQ